LLALSLSIKITPILERVTRDEKERSREVVLRGTAMNNHIGVPFRWRRGQIGGEGIQMGMIGMT